mmetsp:Transcript_1223/g.1396  ORF Transcript_1223/g.1396 Transcript_1223/m.1396 type:complete len:103 (+) Transcript_1223:102-410(+)
MYMQDPKVTHCVFFDVAIDGKEQGRIELDLFGEQAPKTVNNFLALCSGEYKRTMWFKDSKIFKVVGNRWIMGGDITFNDGRGSTTIYDDGKAKTMPAEKNDL